jgi:hypothetical protein
MMTDLNINAGRARQRGPATTETRQHIAVALGLALLVAGVLVVIAVLPAEFAVDPTGIGAKLGLLDLGTVGKQVAELNASTSATGGHAALIVPQEKPFNHETVDFTLPPKGTIEYKYRLEKGESLLYSWKATTAVNFEFHAEPDGAPRGYAQSYEKSSGAGASGTLTAPFPGIHGWYWENTGDQPVTVTLTSAGFYNLAHEFHADGSVRNKSFP